MSHEPADVVLHELYRSLDERWRPEEVASRVLLLLALEPSERATVYKAAQAGKENFHVTMSQDFHRPVSLQRQLQVAQELFGKRVEFAPDDVARIEAWLKDAEKSIGKEFARNDFKHDRLSKAERTKAGIGLSRRQYNKRFRVAVRLEKKARRLAREQFKRSLTLASKNRLAAQISWDDFAADMASACFIAYYVARCNLRSLFTNTTQVRPYDEICDVLMARCQRQKDQTNWWAIAHVLPTVEVLRHLDDEQKGVLLASYFQLLSETAAFLRELWFANQFTDDMVVHKGNDSTTWNVTAGAWNKLRDGWFALMYELGLVEAVERLCPGKVMRLMAADVSWWHRQSGGGIAPETQVWKELPRPWDVLLGDASCPKALVEELCRKHGLDPAQSGWSAPRPKGAVARFTPTPELVHGVVVESPLLAGLFRKLGVFSGKKVKGAVPAATVAEIRERHWRQQEQRRSAKEEARR